MDRRNIFKTMFAAVAGVVATRASAETEPAKDGGVPKVVYHLADAEKVNFVLGNIKNHIEGVGGPDKVTIALVVHGPALRSFQGSTTDADLKSKVGNVSKTGVSLHACVNTLRGMNMTLKDLLPGFVLADKGGVVRLADLQQQGYIYLRP
jgi:intracellular sulfur oxidation DsrE/DsrF family protein